MLYIASTPRVGILDNPRVLHNLLKRKPFGGVLYQKLKKFRFECKLESIHCTIGVCKSLGSHSRGQTYPADEIFGFSRDTGSGRKAQVNFHDPV